MRVAVNDFISLRGTSGSARAVSQIKLALQRSHHVKTLSPRRLPRRGLARAGHMLAWDFLGAPLNARRSGADVIVHGANSGGRLPGLPAVVVMHDTMVLDHPQLFDARFHHYARLSFAASARGARLIVTCSEHSARRITARWPFAEVRAIPWPYFGERIGETEASTGPRTRDVLVVASSDRHKRLPLAVEAVREARAEFAPDMSLTVVARPGNGHAEFMHAVDRADPFRSWISIKEGLPDSELEILYGDAFCLMVPSVDEGYCLPALEATFRGVPVVHLNQGALPEVVGVRQGVDGHETDPDRLRAQLYDLMIESEWRYTRRLATERIERASPERFAESWDAVIREVTSD